MTDSRPCKCMKRALRRLAKEDFLAHIPPTSDLASLFASGDSFEGLSTYNRKSSSSSIDDKLYALRTVRRLLDTSETVCPVPRKTIPSQHAANNPTPSPTKTSSRKSSVRQLQHSVSSRVEDAAQTAAFQTLFFALSNRGSNSPEPNLQTTVNDTSKKYPLPLQNLSMKVGCNERHVTTWDEPDHAFYLFPAQLQITCTSAHDFDPLLVPAVTLVHLVCSTVTINSPYKSHSQILFKTFYDGATIRYVNDTPTPDLSRGIHIGEVPWCLTKNVQSVQPCAKFCYMAFLGPAAGRTGVSVPPELLCSNQNCTPSIVSGISETLTILHWTWPGFAWGLSDMGQLRSLRTDPRANPGCSGGFCDSSG